MRTQYLSILFIFLMACSSGESIESNLIETTTTSDAPTTTLVAPTTTIYVDENIVTSFEEVPSSLVRIVVKSSGVDLDDNLEFSSLTFESSGSGFFISSDGYIITNNHVIAGAVNIDVFTEYREKPYTGKLIGLSECDDIAVLKIEIEDAKYLEFAKEKPILGQSVIAAGFPKGDEEVTFLDGIVSKKEAGGSTSWSSIDYAFEMTAEILPGSSGGPVINEDVKVMGISYRGNQDRQEYGIPIVEVDEIISDIINSNFLYSFGINAEQLPDYGMYIYSVETNSPLYKAGFQGGELVTDIKGSSIVNEFTMDVYCKALKSRGTDSPIAMEGIYLPDMSIFKVNVSLDGSKVELVTVTTTTKPKTQNTSTTTTLPKIEKPFFDKNTLDVYKESFGNVKQYKRWKKSSITIGILGDPSSMQRRIVEETALMFDGLIDNIAITTSNNTKGDMNFYFGAQESWTSVLNDCFDFGGYQTDSLVGRGNYYETVGFSACILPEPSMNNYSKYGICSDGISTCSIYLIRRAFWMSFLNMNEGEAKTQESFFCSMKDYHKNDDIDAWGTQTPGVLPCGGCCNCSTPQFTLLDKEIIKLHYSEYIKEAKTIDEVISMLEN